MPLWHLLPSLSKSDGVKFTASLCNVFGFFVLTLLFFDDFEVLLPHERPSIFFFFVEFFFFLSCQHRMIQLVSVFG